MNDIFTDPSGNMSQSFMKLIQSVTIKYYSKAQEYETMENKMAADGYLDALNKRDTFFTYNDYSKSEYSQVGLIDQIIIAKASNGDLKAIPESYRDKLLELRRRREIYSFEEKNNYYRMLNGLPDLEDTSFFYIHSDISEEYEIDKSIPIHKIQDYYNYIEDGKGDYLISVIEGTGFIEDLAKAHPDKKYLNFIGSNRIDLYTARTAKNFQIIRLKKPDVRQSIIDVFVRIYEQCREYYVKTLYISNYSKFLEFYDNFIAMCIMIMTIQQIAVKQISLGIKREYFDIYAIRTLYETYDIPYNLNIDEDTQSDIVQNLNLLIQNKATDKVLYNITDLLGFSNVNIYKYYLSKEHKMDKFDVPIFKYTEKFNSNTGKMEVVPDYKAMYDLYFQKCNLKDDDFIKSFNDKTNHVKYEEIIGNDPFWWEDQNVYDRVWESEYNYVESKYLSLGVSYSMTEIMFENVILLKLIMREQNEFKNLRIKVPRIIENGDIPIFDAIILLVCLTACKHKLYGEIISVPTQVIAVNDYIENTERDGHYNDTFKFNYNYFFNPDEYEDKTKINEMKSDLVNFINNQDKDDKIVDTLGFNFDYFALNNPKRSENIENIKKILGPEDYKNFEFYVDKVSLVKSGNESERIKALNDMFTSVKGLYRLISFYMTKTDNKEIYTYLKTIYNSLFISKEMNDIFTIQTSYINDETGEYETHQRTAWTYFEYLYHKNPKLYYAIFDFDLNEEYHDYIKKNNIKSSELSFNKFSEKVAKGEIYITYDKINNEIDTGDPAVRDSKIYFYVNHIISRLEMMISDIGFLYLMNDTSTPLETLLMQFVRFFKSYTVDILSLDVIYICDFKPENNIKLFDILHYMKKTIQPEDNFYFEYSDIISRIISKIDLNSTIKANDIAFYDALLIIDEMYGNRNSVRLKDLLYKFETDLQLDDISLIKIDDTVKRVISEVDTEDKVLLTDKISKIWYT